MNLSIFKTFSSKWLSVIVFSIFKNVKNVLYFITEYLEGITNVENVSIFLKLILLAILFPKLNYSPYLPEKDIHQIIRSDYIPFLSLARYE